MKQKKIHRLAGNHNLPFILIALSYPESILKTAWILNKKLAINLIESEIVIQEKDSTTNKFPVFCDRQSSEILYFSLISNKSANNLLVKELPNIDFILEISGEFKKSEITTMIKEIKLIPGIIAAIEVNPEKIKRKTAYCPF